MNRKLLLLCLALSMSAGARAAASAPAAVPPQASVAPIAVVNGVPIPAVFGDIMRRERAARGQGPEQLSDDAVRNALIAGELLAQEAHRQGLDKSPKVIALLEFQRKDLLGRVMLEEFVRTHPIGEETLKTEYEKAKEKAGATEYRVRHILVPTEKEAKEIIAEIKSHKASFEDLAKKRSKDGSASNGGDLGWVTASGLAPGFAAAMEKLKKGQYTTAPVQTTFGWHVIQVDDTRALQVPPFEKVKERIANQLQQIQVRKYLQELRSTAAVE
jgi:peptidyl-prolyl cis-trans isomerase C